jgi:hypothetical protein
VIVEADTVEYTVVYIACPHELAEEELGVEDTVLDDDATALDIVSEAVLLEATALLLDKLELIAALLDGSEEERLDEVDGFADSEALADDNELLSDDDVEEDTAAEGDVLLDDTAAEDDILLDDTAAEDDIPEDWAAEEDSEDVPLLLAGALERLDVLWYELDAAPLDCDEETDDVVDGIAPEDEAEELLSCNDPDDWAAEDEVPEDTAAEEVPEDTAAENSDEDVIVPDEEAERVPDAEADSEDEPLLLAGALERLVVGIEVEAAPLDSDEGEGVVEADAPIELWYELEAAPEGAALDVALERVAVELWEALPAAIEELEVVYCVEEAAEEVPAEGVSYFRLIGVFRSFKIFSRTLYIIIWPVARFAILVLKARFFIPAQACAESPSQAVSQ